MFWSLVDDQQLSQAAHTAIKSKDNEVFVSIATAWEMAIKVGLGKWPEAAPLVQAFEQELATARFRVMLITIEHARTSGLMVAKHRDPFDRLLAAQAIVEDLTLVTSDPKMIALCARCLW